MNAVQDASAAESAATVLFEYSGRLSESVVLTTSQNLRTKLAAAGVCANQARKIFSSYVELAYNILHYAQAEIDTAVACAHWGRLVVARQGAQYAVSSNNQISCAQADLLMSRLAQLRSMSEAAIRFEYRLRLTNLQYEPADQSGMGASLGLLTVARNAVRPLEYSVHRDDEKSSACFISIHTLI